MAGASPAPPDQAAIDLAATPIYFPGTLSLQPAAEAEHLQRIQARLAEHVHTPHLQYPLFLVIPYGGLGSDDDAVLYSYRHPACVDGKWICKDGSLTDLTFISRPMYDLDVQSPPTSVSGEMCYGLRWSNSQLQSILAPRDPRLHLCAQGRSAPYVTIAIAGPNGDARRAIGLYAVANISLARMAVTDLTLIGRDTETGAILRETLNAQ